MGQFHRPIRAGAAAAVGLAVTAMTGALASTAAVAAARAAAPRLVAIAGSVRATTDARTGVYHSPAMSVEVVLAARHQAAMNASLRAIYTPGSRDYQRWLARGQFDARYAPSRARRAAVAGYLRSQGLTIAPSSTPFLVRAAGTNRRISAAFHTRLSTYVDSRGVRYFANSSAVALPAALAHGVLGVIGLANTVRLRPMALRPAYIRPAARSASRRGCETRYPTRKQLFAAQLHGKFFRYGYGAGPGCSGMTPSQVNSLYGAPHVGPGGQGRGQTIAVFELSAYRGSDIRAWTRQFYGRAYRPPLRNVNVDGGPLHPHCPHGDICPPDFNGYAGDVEVDADIETELAMAPHVRHLIVYNAPNDETGQTEIDEYARIAKGDVAASISSSWGLCEAATPLANALAENQIFKQMAMQGQSMFGDAGDTGAFGCIRDNRAVNVNVQDPAAQPWVTSVGGTSLENYNPGTRRRPHYPRTGETVWNTGALCNRSVDEGGEPGLYWCNATGAGGGGSSQFWGRPFYQRGKGTISKYTTYGGTHCVRALGHAPCRATPDVSAFADEYTPYAEHCTGNAHTPFSICRGIASDHGWFGIGGTSLSSPLWAGIAVDRASYLGHRIGNMNPLLYRLYRKAPGRYFHNVLGKGRMTRNNGLYPAVRGYDLATGIGTPKLKALITGRR